MARKYLMSFIFQSWCEQDFESLFIFYLFICSQTVKQCLNQPYIALDEAYIWSFLFNVQFQIIIGP